MPRTFAIIMAGGTGTRFWPLSRSSRPKQLLPLAGGDESLLSATIRRVTAVVDRQDVLIVTSESLVSAVRGDVDLPAHNILAEPVGRNTAPCIGWAATRVARVDRDAVCIVLPADHHVVDELAYSAALKTAVHAAAGGEIVTVGVRPSRAETGYGYIELGDELGHGVHRVRRFVEKPNRQRAEQLLASGTNLWNSGMFFFRAGAMLDAIDEHLPGLGAVLRSFSAATLEEEAALVQEKFRSLPSISIDHGVMEKMAGTAVVPADFGWSDLGSFASAWELAPRDGDQNALGEAIAYDSRGCYVHAPVGKLVAIVGLEDVVVVDTEDALLVVPRDRAQDVKAIVEVLRERGDERL